MTRKRQPLFDTSRRRLLGPDDIPPDLLARDWKVESPASASRYGPGGSVTAWVAGDELIYNDAGHHALVWTGESECPRRRLEASFDDGVTTIRAVEAAEAEGPHSAAWEGQSGAPQRDGWKHTVRRRRDVWFCLTPDRHPIVVLQLPPERIGRLCYMAWIDGHCIGRGGEPRRFTDPIAAMVEAEYETGLDGAIISARSLMAAV
jgi:hypothetical protein